MSRRGGASTRQIELRQRQEDHVNNYNNVANEHARQKLKCQWEHSTERKIQNNMLYKTMDRVQAQHDDLLIARRKRLAEMLEAEREEHEAMLAKLVVSDEERRERLMQKARDLRVTREEIRQGEAARRKDQLFREQSSLVREAESKIKVLHVAEQRRAQIEENQRRKAEQAAEDRFYEEQAMEEGRLQNARAQRDLETLHVRSQQTRANMDLQVEHNKARKEAERQAALAEDEKQKQLILAGIEADAKAEAARRQKQRDVAAATKAQNEQLDALRAVEEQKRREEEKKELDDLLAKIAEDERKEQERKKAAREDAVYQLKFVEAQMNAQAESATALDRQWEEENDKQWARREEGWKAEQNRREKLLVDVYQTRQAQIHQLRDQEQQVQQTKKRDHEDVMNLMSTMGSQDAGSKQKKRDEAVANRKWIESQMAEKAAIKKQERDAKRHELTASQATEQMYQDKIKSELGKLEGAKPASYQSVPLSRPKKGISGLN